MDSSWREAVLTRVLEQRKMLGWLSERDGALDSQALTAGSLAHLAAAENAARVCGPKAKMLAAISGASVERASGHLDAVECDLLRLAGAGYQRGQMPSLLSHVRRHLGPEDPRRREVERLAKHSDAPWRELDSERVVAAVHAASSQARREVRQVRSFRNTLYATALGLTIVALALAAVGLRSPAAIPLCFNPGSSVVCPTGQTQVAAPTGAAVASNLDRVQKGVHAVAHRGDVALIELIGLLAAALAAAVALRNIKGTSSPYSLPIALAILKLPTGALTAVVALVLMRGAFIPGFSALDSSAQILAWAVVFGYAQELFTRLVDRQAHSVLDNVRAGGTAPAQAVGAEAAAW